MLNGGFAEKVRGLFRAVGNVGLVAALLLATGPASAGVIYFSDIFNPTFFDGSIRSVNTDGTGLNTILDTGGGLRGIDIDPAAGLMYWTDTNIPAVRRATLTGGNITNLITSGLDFPSDVAVNPAGGKLYFGDQVDATIVQANLDGSNPVVLRSTPFHRGIAVDAVHGKLYWSTSLSDLKGEILRSNLDGSGLETVVTSLDPLFKPASIAIDPVGGWVYWTDYVVDVVRRATLSGTNIQDLYTVGSNRNPRGIAVDVAAGKVYWGQDDEIDGTTGHIMRMNLDGTFPETVVSGLGLVQDMVIVPEPGALSLLLVGAAGLAARRRS